MTKRASSKKVRIAATMTIALLIGAGALGLSHASAHRSTITTFEVKREEFVDSIQFHGDVKAMKSVTITAPANVGELQILKLAANGAQVKKGDMVVEFDKSKTEVDMKEYQSALKSAQAEIDESRAKAHLLEEQDLTAVSKAKYDVIVAKLDASKQEIVSKIEGGEAALKLADAEQKEKEAEAKLKSDRFADKAAVDAKISASKKAQYDVERAEHAFSTMTLTSPADGAINLTTTWHGGGVSPFKPGDQVWSGAPIAELPDASSLRVSARVDEAERGRLSLHQPATVQLDAIAGQQFTGKLEQIGTIATTDFTAGWPIPKNFDLKIALDKDDPRLRPAMTAQITVIVDRVPNAIAIPAQATFQRSGRTVVYVAQGDKYTERAIEVGRRSRDRILVMNGLQAGEHIALEDPLLKE